MSSSISSSQQPVPSGTVNSPFFESECCTNLFSIFNSISPSTEDPSSSGQRSPWKDHSITPTAIKEPRRLHVAFNFIDLEATTRLLEQALSDSLSIGPGRVNVEDRSVQDSIAHEHYGAFWEVDPLAQLKFAGGVWTEAHS